MAENNQLVFSDELLEEIANLNISWLGKVYGVVSVACKSMKEVYGLDEVVFNNNAQAMTFIGFVKSNEEREPFAVVNWSLSGESVTLSILRPNDNITIASAVLNLSLNEYTEHFGRFEDLEFKDKTRQWFDTLSKIDINGVSEFGRIYHTSESNGDDVPKVDAEIVSEG